MTISQAIIQEPAPGSQTLKTRGDTITFVLTLPKTEKGNAYLRSNIGYAHITQNEIIEKVDNDTPPMARDWFDIPMVKTAPRQYKVTLPLSQVGHFEAKCYFMREKADQPAWPQGDNTQINVEPTDVCCANIIYNAFIRQFGPNKTGALKGEFENECIHTLDEMGYTVIPPSGRFRDLIKELDFIVGELGCRYIHLLPVHPTPTIYGRMGRFGSPYAALNYTSVDPALAEFDAKATPLEQFLELVDAIHQRNAGIIIDVAPNHTGWAASLHETHPHWLVRDEEGRIEVPGAWGVQWEDLTRLDYTHKDLWQYMADMFLTWCHRGVDGFRCDAGYMIPTPAWQYIVARVRKEYPETLFFLEGLGGKLSVTDEILNIANFDWAYSELFQNYDRNQIEHYLPTASHSSYTQGIMIHFAETHDNNRLAAKSKIWAQMRTSLCALVSHQGGFGFANGVEWYATEKINVHEANSLNWGNATNQVAHIRRLSYLLKHHPAFFDQTEVTLVQKGEGNHIVVSRFHPPTQSRLLVVVNLDDTHKTTAFYDPKAVLMPQTELYDLLTMTRVRVTATDDGLFAVDLDPGQVYCLATTQELPPPQEDAFALPPRIIDQRLRAKTLEALSHYRSVRDISDFDPDAAARFLEKDPREFLRDLNPCSDESRMMTFSWPEDEKREVMVPPDHFLLVTAETFFSARIIAKNATQDITLRSETAFQKKDGTFFTLFSPLDVPAAHQPYRLNLVVYETPPRHYEGHLLYLSYPEDALIQQEFQRGDPRLDEMTFLSTNNRGGMMRTPVNWGRLDSKYDALLAANIHPMFPEDRRIMFTRCRAWIVFQDYSNAIHLDCLDSFSFDYYTGCSFQYHISTGQGKHILLSWSLSMVEDENTVCMQITRSPSYGISDRLEDRQAVRLILRPDIEDRNFHDTTKAFTGPETLYPDSVHTIQNGFEFAPTGPHALTMILKDGAFHSDPEWVYMVFRPKDAQRGLDPNSDLFSPGYFAIDLLGGANTELIATIVSPKEKRPDLTKLKPEYNAPHLINKNLPIGKGIPRAITSYVVRRGELKSVIAGYPWFLDWGRDALIFARGLIAAGRTRDARDMAKQFGRFEEKGTLPNMIAGDNAENRETSDAPLWFFRVVADLVKKEGDEGFLDEVITDATPPKRTVRECLISMGENLWSGTPVGVYADKETGLLFSPPHYTWMDTNYPAGTPRMGYCIEIQALWYAALRFLAQIDPQALKNDWKGKAELVQEAINERFPLPCGYLSDCLHAESGMPVRHTEADDALRPNQLLAITLGAVTDHRRCRDILDACETLLIPGAIRSLANRRLSVPLEIRHQGHLLNDPYHPYQGFYEGDEDTRRKPAYHNGTAWTWPFPNYCEAYVKVYGKESVRTALSILGSATLYLNSGCIGHLPEIADGDFPHTPRGCDAQAWGESELIRVWKTLQLKYR